MHSLLQQLAAALVGGHPGLTMSTAGLVDVSRSAKAGRFARLALLCLFSTSSSYAITGASLSGLNLRTAAPSSALDSSWAPTSKPCNDRQQQQQQCTIVIGS
jgi:hypothetical protein